MQLAYFVEKLRQISTKYKWWGNSSKYGNTNREIFTKKYEKYGLPVLICIYSGENFLESELIES